MTQKLNCRAVKILDVTLKAEQGFSTSLTFASAELRKHFALSVYISASFGIRHRARKPSSYKASFRSTLQEKEDQSLKEKG